MAMLGRKQPVAPQPAPGSAKPRTAAAGSVGNDTSRIGRMRTNINDIRSELRKVTWPTREETRNLTIVVIGITAVLGTLLGTIDAILNYIYQLVNR